MFEHIAPWVAAVLGWLGGVSSALLLDLNRRRRSFRTIKTTLDFELVELRLQLVAMVWQFSKCSASVTSELLVWLLEAYRRYDGPQNHSRDVEMIKAAIERNQPSGIYDSSDSQICTLAAPALDAAQGALLEFSAPRQRRLLELRLLLALYHAQIAEATHVLARVKTPEWKQESPGQHAILIRAEIYKQLAAAARRVIEKIDYFQAI